MKTFISFFSLLFICQITIAQITFIDSIPVLITDTQSINRHYAVPFYVWGNSDSLPVFYEKKQTISDTASIWCRNINSLSPEKLFLQSNGGIIFSDPTPDKNNILWCESNFQGQFDIYGFQYDDNFNITDTFRLTGDTLIETSIVATNDNNIYWIQKNDSLLIEQTFSINSGNINLLAKDTIDNKIISVYPDSNNQVLYTRFENDSVHLYCCSHNAKDTLGNVSYVNASWYALGQSYLWERNDTVFSPDVNSIIFVNQFNPHLPLLPAILTVDIPIKFMIGWPTLAYTVKDSTFVFAISWTNTVSNIGSKTYYYFTDYIEPWTYCYYFPPDYDIKEIRFFQGNNNVDYNICILRVSKNGYERLYLLRFYIMLSISNIISERQDNNLSIYPNPSKGNFTIELPENTEPEQLTISNITGKILKVIPLSKGQTTYQFKEKLPPGIYFVKVQTNNGTVVRKFVKQ